MTLIEVLISAVIMFSVLVVMANLVSVATISSQRAEQRVAEVTYLPLLLPQIKFQLVQSDKSAQLGGNLEVMGRQFQWQAEMLQEQRMHYVSVDLAVSLESLPMVQTYRVDVSSVDNPGLNWSYTEWLL